MRRSAIRDLLLATALIASAPTQAAVYCAQNSAQLALALQASSGDGVSDTIRITANVYASPAGFSGFTANGESLTIEGGWATVFSDCNINTFDPTITVLDGQEQRPSLRLAVNPGGGAITVRGITFFRGRAVAAPNFRGGGLQIDATIGSVANVLVERNIFRQCIAQQVGGGANVESEGGTITIRNNLAYANSAPQGAGIYAFGNNATTYVNNNTITANYSGNGTSPSVAFGRFGSSDVFLNNNIMWGNTAGSQSDVLADPNVVFIANDIQKIAGGAPVAPSTGNVSVDPGFVLNGSDFRLRDSSPLVDDGVDPPIGGVPTLDLAGQRRNAGRVDIGAYETDRLIASGFEN